MRVLTLFTAFLLSVGFVLQASASRDCENLLRAGQLRPDFQHSKNYDVEVSSPFKIKNQCSTPFCHLYTWTSGLESQSEIEISDEYVAAAYLYNSAEKALHEGKSSFTANLGAHAISSLMAIRKSGLIPKGAWQAKTDFNKTPHITRLLEALQNIVARTSALRAQLESEQDQAEITQKASVQMLSLFDAFVGELPSQVEFEGKSFTPLEFAQTHFPHLFLPIVKLNVAYGELEGRSIGKANDDGVEIKLPRSEMKKTLIKVLDSGNPIFLAYQQKYQYTDVSTGIMSISGFDYPEFALPVEFATRDKQFLWTDMHAVLLTGYELDPLTGQVRKWKIQNSWGEKHGDGGIFHMYDDFFDQFVSSASFLDKGLVALPHFDPPDSPPAPANEN